MPHILTRNRINVRPGDPAFAISSNLCDWFELGTQEGDDYWLEGDIVGDGEFVFNGRLYLPSSNVFGTIIDNFPKGPAPQGWTKRMNPANDGYQLVAEDGLVLFGYVTDGNLCMVNVNIYAADGSLVAESLSNEFRLHRHPAKIGRGGIYFT